MPTDFNRRTDDRPLRNFAMLALIVTLIVALLCFYAGRVSGARSVALTVRQVEAAPAPRELPAEVERFHDATEGVTCWRTGVGRRAEGISCLPDQWLATARKDDLP